MSIELHCPNCSLLIRAPDDAGGKHGRCPSCKASVYIPSKVTEADVIPLAPLDEADVRREEELWEESVDYIAGLDRDFGANTAEEERPQRPAEVPGEVIDVPGMVAKFVVAMRDSKLDDAQKVVARLQRVGVRARDYVEGLYLDQMPPRIKDVPPQLAKGFIKHLLDQLS